MKLLKTFMTTLVVTPFVAMSLPLNSLKVMAETGMDGSYVGAGIAAGLTEHDHDDAQFGGNVQGRWQIPESNVPISLRGAALFGGGTVALVPTVTYDVPLARNTNLYIGGGYSFVLDDNHPTQLGNEDAPVITAGIENAVNENVVVFGDAKWGIDAYEDSSADAVSLQAGVGVRF